MKIIDRFDNIKDTYNPMNIIPFFTENEKKSMWLNYLYNHSGQKEESPLLKNYVFHNTPFLETLNDILSVNFLDKWTRLHDALILEYGVIDNYNRVEDTEINTTGGSTTTDESSSSDIMSGGHNTSNEYTNNHQTSSYDSDVYVDDNADTSSNNENFTYNDETKTTTSSSETESENSNNVITHSVITGNIGVTTSQQMLISEIELRKYNIIDTIYSDIDSILTLAVYI